MLIMLDPFCCSDMRLFFPLLVRFFFLLKRVCNGPNWSKHEESGGFKRKKGFYLPKKQETTYNNN